MSLDKNLGPTFLRNNPFNGSPAILWAWMPRPQCLETSFRRSSGLAESQRGCFLSNPHVPCLNWRLWGNMHLFFNIATCTELPWDLGSLWAARLAWPCQPLGPQSNTMALIWKFCLLGSASRLSLWVQNRIICSRVHFYQCVFWDPWTCASRLLADFFPNIAAVQRHVWIYFFNLLTFSFAEITWLHPKCVPPKKNVFGFSVLIVDCLPSKLWVTEGHLPVPKVATKSMPRQANKFQQNDVLLKLLQSGDLFDAPGVVSLLRSDPNMVRFW